LDPTRQEEESVTLMRFDPFRELERLAEQTLFVEARALRSEFGDNVDAYRLTADAQDVVLTITTPVSEASKPRGVVPDSAGAGPPVP